MATLVEKGVVLSILKIVNKLKKVKHLVYSFLAVVYLPRRKIDEDLS